MAILALGLVGAGCAAAHRGVDIPAIEGPGRPWPNGVPACRIEGSAGRGCRNDYFELLNSEGTTVALLQSDGSAVWSDLPKLGEKPMARLTYGSSVVAAEGYGRIDQATSFVLHNVAILPGMLWIPATAPVHVVGTDLDNVIIEVETPFQAPKTVRARASCADFDGRPPEVTVTHGPPCVLPSGGWLDVSEKPRGPVRFSFQPDPERGFVRYLTRDGFVRIMGGSSPFREDLNGVPLYLDGWVPENEVQDGTAIDLVDSACSEPPEAPVCGTLKSSTQLTLRTTPDTNAPEVALLGPNVAVTELERRGEFSSIAVQAEPIRPALGGALWVDTAGLEPRCAKRAAPDRACRCPEEERDDLPQYD